MKYYYIHPFKPQYFFPKGFKKYDLFLSFFTPYSITGRISWFLFKRFNFYRILFAKNNIEAYIPEQYIRKIIAEDAVMAFNKGTIGPEQKITALGLSNKKKFFVKYAQTIIAKENVTNEHFILEQISHLDFVPKVLDFYSDETQILLKTNVLKGECLKNKTLEKIIINRLITIANQKVEIIKTTKSRLKTSFAHGDFCPWNMMINNHNILIFDWEMAGNYTLGYDLFTFIFQTSFLLSSNVSIQDTILENIKSIEEYFSHFNLSNWKPYLQAFALEKVGLEQLKVDKVMFTKYFKLLEYAKEA